MEPEPAHRGDLEVGSYVGVGGVAYRVTHIDHGVIRMVNKAGWTTSINATGDPVVRLVPTMREALDAVLRVFPDAQYLGQEKTP